MTTIATPTQDQIAQVQTNLANMQQFNDYVYNHGNARIANAYQLLAASDTSDPGVKFGISILKKAFQAFIDVGVGAADTPAPIVEKGVTFLCGMLDSWSADPPDGLTPNQSTLVNRVEATSEQIDTQLSTYHKYVAENWDVAFAENGKSVAVSDLSDPADGTFPLETDPEFMVLAKQALFALDQTVWQYLLAQNCHITQLVSAPYVVQSNDPNTQPTAWVQQFYAKNPAYHLTWSWFKGSVLAGIPKGWEMTQYVVGRRPSWPHDNAIGNAACQYLFIDSTDGLVINANGLYTRNTVFNGLGIPTEQYTVP